MLGFLYVFVGGGLGAVSRYGIQHISLLAPGNKFWLTSIVNLVGCLLIGVAWAFVSTHCAGKTFSQLVIAGFLGGFTTFSTFSFDTFDMLRDGRVALAFLYVGVTLIGGLLLTYIGYTFTTKLLQ